MRVSLPISRSTRLPGNHRRLQRAVTGQHVHPGTGDASIIARRTSGTHAGAGDSIAKAYNGASQIRKWVYLFILSHHVLLVLFTCWLFSRVLHGNKAGWSSDSHRRNQAFREANVECCVCFLKMSKCCIAEQKASKVETK